jgi:uncharacterized RDD family membrane protein YckC
VIPVEAGASLRNDLYGRSAGVATRLFASLVDLVTILLLFTLGGHVITFVLSVVLGDEVHLSETPLASSFALLVWAFAYCAYLLSAYSCTLGMALFGIRVVRLDGGTIHTRHAVVRVLAFPLSFLVFCFGFVLIVLRRDRCALHDLIARTSVVYSWEARSANLGFLTKRRPDGAGDDRAMAANGKRPSEEGL